MTISQTERDAAHIAMETEMVANDTPQMSEQERFVAHMAEQYEPGIASVPDDALGLLITRGNNEFLNNNRFVTITYKDADGGEKEEKHRKFDHHDFTTWLLNETGEHYATLNDNGDIFYYADGVYVPNGKQRIAFIVDSVIDSAMANSYTRKEVVNAIIARTSIDRTAFDADDNIINMANGLYHIDTGELIPHTPGYLSFSKLGVVYDPDATCPVFDAFVVDVVEPYRRDAIYEMFGYTLIPKKTLKLAVIFSGHSDTGKSTMIAALHTFIGGEQNVALASPVAIGADIFASSDLYGKLLNYVDDLGTSPIVETGTLKSIISCKPIRGNQKYGNVFQFVPRALLLFACNLVPPCEDEYLANKFDIFEFNNVFVGETKNPHMEYDITTPAELSGIFNKAIAGVKVALENKSFTGTKTIHDRQQEFEFHSNPVARFVDGCCDMTDAEAYVDKKVFRQAYITWSKDNNLKAMAVGTCTTWLQDHGVMLTREGGRGEQTWVYMGIDIVGDIPAVNVVLYTNDMSGVESNDRVTEQLVASAIYTVTYSRGMKAFTPADVIMAMDRSIGATIESVSYVMQAHSTELKITCVGDKWEMIPK